MSSVSGAGVKGVLRTLYQTITNVAEEEMRKNMPETAWHPHDDAQGK